MRCGNDPRSRPTPADQAWVDWFAAFLTWAKTPRAERGPEPVQPDGLLASTGKPPTGEAVK